MSQNPYESPTPHPTPPPKPKYERSGCYPEHGRPFRVWALLGVLALVVLILAGISALLNFLLT